MYPWRRPEEPPEMRAARAELTREFAAEKRRTGKTPACAWPKVKNPDGEVETLQKWMARQTLRHCSYCDSVMGYSSRDTIDHFLPKSQFHCLAYAWKNLYLCCDGCQRKGTRYDRQTLRPDEEGENRYQFDRYFSMGADGYLRVTAVNAADKLRAETTIRVLDLNDPELVRDRRLAFNQSLSPRLRPALEEETETRLSDPFIDDLPFRFIYGPPPDEAA